MKPSFLAIMLDIDGDDYGLGVHRFDKKLTGGKPAIGHGGGNIGMMTYMNHWPEYRISLVVSINAFHADCLNMITRSISRIVMDRK